MTLSNNKRSLSSIVNNNDIKQLISKHNLFGNIRNKYGIPPNWQRLQGFISLSKIILEQQVSLASAEAHFIKLNNYLSDFSPKEILKLTDTEMRYCQISRQKAKYLREISTAVINKKLIFEELPKLSTDEVRKKLTSIKGIGNWTTDIYLIFCLQSKDVFPLGDIALVNTIKELTKTRAKEGIVRLTNNWKPLRSLAAYFLWYYYLKKRNRI